jgi:hypothetical protein
MIISQMRRTLPKSRSKKEIKWLRMQGISMRMMLRRDEDRAVLIYTETRRQGKAGCGMVFREQTRSHYEYGV